MSLLFQNEKRARLMVELAHQRMREADKAEEGSSRCTSPAHSLTSSQSNLLSCWNSNLQFQGSGNGSVQEDRHHSPIRARQSRIRLVEYSPSSASSCATDVSTSSTVQNFSPAVGQRRVNHLISGVANKENLRPGGLTPTKRSKTAALGIEATRRNDALLLLEFSNDGANRKRSTEEKEDNFLIPRKDGENGQRNTGTDEIEGDLVPGEGNLGQETRRRPKRRCAENKTVIAGGNDSDVTRSDFSDSESSVFLLDEHSSSSAFSSDPDEPDQISARLRSSNAHKFNCRQPNSPCRSSMMNDIELEQMEASEPESESDVNILRQKKETAKEQKAMKKYLRNSGKEYVSTSGKVVKARKRMPTHTCKWQKCHEKITDEVGDSLFHEYWEQESHDKRVAYVANRVDIAPIKRKRRRGGSRKHQHPKTVSYTYWFYVNGEKMRVCKATFLGVLGETDGFLRLAVKNKRSNFSGISHDDKRGKQKPKHKLTEKQVEAVTNHINSFPSYRSHYARARTGETRYLPSTLNVTIMYEKYCEGNNPKLSYQTYRRIFKKIGRKFKQPATDTCAKCDEFAILEKRLQDEELENMKKRWEEHLKRADAAYKRKREEKERAERDPSRRVLIFDLEQCLETPLVRSGTSFYLRQLYTFNLTVFDPSLNKTFCYMWHEGAGGRGGNQIATCLFRHILTEVPDSVTHVTLFSDSCSGQNRNSHVSAMYFVLLQVHKSVTSIDHIFLETGHTRLECDSRHSVIEKAKKQVERINVPSDWYSLIQSLNKRTAASPEGTFEVIEMIHENFCDFASLLKGPLVLRNTTVGGGKFLWFQTQHFRYRHESIGIVQVSRKCDGSERFEELSFLRKGKKKSVLGNLSEQLGHCYNGPVPISKEKKADLMKLLHLIDEEHHSFYESLKTDDVPDVDPDIVIDEAEIQEEIEPEADA